LRSGSSARRIVYGYHPVAALLDAGRCRVYQVMLVHGGTSPSLGALRSMISAAGVRVNEVDRNTLDQVAGTRSHQGVVAQCTDYPYAGLEDVVSVSGRGPVLLLDQVQDPQNLGAILRSALFFGARGVILPRSRSAQVTPAVTKASAGASEYLVVARTGGIDQAVRSLKSKGFWIIGAEADGEMKPEAAPWDQDCALILGGEDSGLRRVLRNRCDAVVGIRGVQKGVGCLNVATAAGVLLFAAHSGSSGDLEKMSDFKK